MPRWILCCFQMPQVHTKLATLFRACSSSLYYSVLGALKIKNRAGSKWVATNVTCPTRPITFEQLPICEGLLNRVTQKKKVYKCISLVLLNVPLIYILKINHLQACAGGLSSQEVETLLTPQDGQMAMGKGELHFLYFLSVQYILVTISTYF